MVNHSDVYRSYILGDDVTCDDVLGQTVYTIELGTNGIGFGMNVVISTLITIHTGDICERERLPILENKFHVSCQLYNL